MHSDLIDVDLGNSNYWEQEIFQVLTKPLGTSGIRLPIPDFDIPLERRSRIMAARCYNPVAKPWWKLGCHLKQVIPAPGGINGTFCITSWRIPLYHHESSREQRIFFPDSVTLNWQLKASIPEWHDEIELSIWRFTGDIPAEVIRQIQFVRERQILQNDKLDEILSRV